MSGLIAWFRVHRVYLFGTVVGLVVLATGLAGMCGVRWAGDHDHCREMVGLTAAWLACVANEWRRSGSEREWGTE